MMTLSNSQRRSIKMYAGYSTDPSLNTECNAGEPMTNDGVINCFVTGAQYLQIVFDDVSAIDLELNELSIFSQYD